MQMNSKAIEIHSKYQRKRSQMARLHFHRGGAHPAPPNLHEIVMKSIRYRMISDGGHPKSCMISYEIVRNRIRLWVGTKSSRNRTISYRFRNDFITIWGGWCPPATRNRYEIVMKSIRNRTISEGGAPKIVYDFIRNRTKSYTIVGWCEIVTKSYDFISIS